MPTYKLTRRGKQMVKDTIEIIRKHPDSFEMKSWCRIPENAKPFNRRTYNCGTTLCFAGHMAVLAGFRPKQLQDLENEFRTSKPSTRIPVDLKRLVNSTRRVDDGNLDAGDIALRLMFGQHHKVTSQQSYRLFLSTFWPQPFQTQYNYASTKSAEADVAIRRFEYLLKEGE